MKIMVFGAGSWGTALAVMASERHEVTLWARDPAQARALQSQRENRRYRPHGIVLARGLGLGIPPAHRPWQEPLIFPVPKVALTGLNAAESQPFEKIRA